jgi:hypothetical protein
MTRRAAMVFPARTGVAAIKEAKWADFTSNGRTLVKGTAKSGISRHDGAVEAALSELASAWSGIVLRNSQSRPGSRYTNDPSGH